jgi:ATP-dependent Lhr-like helicase
MPKVNDLLQKLLMNHYITNEKVAFLHRWLSGKSGLNSELKSPESSGTRASTRSTAQRRVNKFRELLTQQGVGGGGRGLGARSVVTDSIAMEGRWQFIEKHESVSDDDYYAAWSALLIARYGVVCREVVKFAAPGVDWPAFSQWLEAAEWRGELRRGYFVEGLSGLQFTDESTMQEFAIWQNELNGDAPAGKFQLLSAIDPLNLYGASAPLDLPLLESGRARLPRIPGNMIVFCAGRPVWIVQERGARLTVIPHSDELVQRESLQFLVEKFTFNSTKWTIETIDGDASAKSLWAKDLVELGFFRDGLNLTRYRGLM